MSVYLLSTANFAGLMALVAISFGVASRTISRPLLQKIALGVILGFGAAAASLQPFMFVNGLQIDPRNLFVGCAGAFVGPLAGIISFAMAALTRYYEGEPSAAVCILSLFVATCAGLAWRYFTRNRERTDERLLLVLGGAISLSYVCTFLLPSTYWATVFSSAVPFLVLTNLIGSSLLGGFLERERRRAKRWRRLQTQALLDPLTGLSNRRAFEEAYAIAVGAEDSSGTAFILIDLDHFKLVNDTYGHAIGDSVLVAVARNVSDSVRERDLVARFGGEEFAVCLPNSTKEQAAVIAQRIRRAISDVQKTKAVSGLSIAASVGVCWSEAALELEAAFDRADRALYQAKINGRDQVVFSEHVEPSSTSSGPSRAPRITGQTANS